jgi:D-arginine dehydrogenase
MNTSDVLIIGGGVLGTSLAYHLSKRNVSVRLLEKESGVARHASGKNAGMMRHLYRHPQLTEWAERSILGLPLQLKERHFRTTGSIIAGRSCPGHHTHLFEEGKITVATGTFPFIYTRCDGLLDSGSYLEDLRALCTDLGVRFSFSSNVLSTERHASLWKVNTQKGSFLAPWVVNASGAWLNSILAPQHKKHEVATQSYARYLFLSEGWHSTPDAKHPYGFYWDEVHQWYMRDWDEGKMLISACDTIPADPDLFVHDPSIVENISRRILDTIPELAREVRIGSGWHCFRTYTDDQLPVWGPDQHLENFFWLGGFGGFGMSTSYAATEDAAASICGERIFSYDDFAPARVQEKNNKYTQDLYANL